MHAGRDADQQPVERRAPRCLLVRGHAQRLARGRIVAPAHVRGMRHGTERIDVGLGQAKCGVHQRVRQQLEHLAVRQSPTMQPEQHQEGVGGFILATRRPIGDAIPDLRHIGLRHTEHRIHEWRPRRGIGHQQQQVMRPQRCIIRHRGKQLVAHDLQLPQLSMRTVHAQRGIVGRERERHRAIVATRKLRLQRAQQRRLRRRRDIVSHRVVHRTMRLQGRQELAALRPELCHQRMRRRRRDRCRVHRHRHVPCECGQQFNEERRQRAHAEDGQPRGQAVRCRSVQPLDGLVNACTAGSMGRRAIRTQLSPERGLPRGMRRTRRTTAALPVLQQVGAIQLIIVQTTGDLRRQPEPRTIVAPDQVIAERRMHRVVAHGAQQFVDTPRQRIAREWVLFEPRRRVAAQPRSKVVHAAGGKRQCQRAHAAMRVGQRQRHPAPHALALHHHHLALARWQRRTPHVCGHVLQQRHESTGCAKLHSAGHAISTKSVRASHPDHP